MRAGKQRCKVGDKVQLYTGQRTKQCRFLAESICTLALPVAFTPNFFRFDGVDFDPRLREKIAREDGFKGWDELVGFFFPIWTEPTTFVGHLYKWRPPV